MSTTASEPQIEWVDLGEEDEDEGEIEIIVKFRSGAKMFFSPDVIPGLRNATSEDLRADRVTPTGHSIRWPALGVRMGTSTLIALVCGKTLASAKTP